MRRPAIRTARTVCCATAAIALAPAVPAPALAADVSLDAGALRVVDALAEPNALDVRSTPVGFEVFDDRAELTAGAGCIALDPHRVACPAMTVRVWIDAGGGDDAVLLEGIGVPTEVAGGAGDDLIEGGDRDDRLVGGAGDDTVLGGAGDDQIAGAGGDDLLQGAAGGDRIAGGADADIVAGESGGGDVLTGGAGPDLIRGGAGADSLDGGPGADVLVTGGGADTATTGSGSDQVFGSAGDSVSCTPGDEVSGARAARAPGCGRLPRGDAPPRIWPPPPGGEPAGSGAAARDGETVARAGLGVRAAGIPFVLPAGVYPGVVLHRGDARTIVLRIAHRYNVPVTVRVRTYDRSGQRIATFRVSAHTKNPVRIVNSHAVADVWSARIRCCLR